MIKRDKNFRMAKQIKRQLAVLFQPFRSQYKNLMNSLILTIYLVYLEYEKNLWTTTTTTTTEQQAPDLGKMLINEAGLNVLTYSNLHP